MNRLGNAVSRWARSREGLVSLVVATVITLAQIDRPRDILVSPLVFVGAAAAAALCVAVIARIWDSSGWPEAPAFARKPATTSASKMLKEDSNATLLVDRGGFLCRRRTFFTATGLAPLQLDRRWLAEACSQQLHEPVEIVATDARTWWWYADTFYWENAGYEQRDVLALITRRERRHDQELQRAHALLTLGEAGGPRREPIPQDVRRAVFTRDGGRCVNCSAEFDLQYDHIIPVALGGATTAANLQLLCSDCNREKSASL